MVSYLINLIQNFQEITKAVDESRAIDAVYMDLANPLIRFHMVVCLGRLDRKEFKEN